MPTILLDSFAGGLNDADPPTALPDDQVVLAENIEFFTARLGAKRPGTTQVSLSGSTVLPTCSGVYHVSKYDVTNDETEARLMAVSVSGSAATLNMKTTAWSNTAFSGANELDTSRGLYSIYSVSMHGKWFCAYPSTGNVDRLHVFEVGTGWRRAGIAPASAAPTFSGSGGAGSYSGTRYARVRFVKQTAGVTDLRSEPSPELTANPSGTTASGTFTRPTAPGDNETHWEIELSTDGANFYRMSTIALATTTYVDSTPFATGYADAGTLSDDIGDYTVPYSAKYLLADDDRLLLLGAHENANYKSRVSWTVVYGDVTGVGNDERIPIDTDNFVDLDGFQGGEITGGAGPLYGYLYVFKQSHIYKLVRTGNRVQAYQAIRISDVKGALPGSIFVGLDERGDACIYFTDRKLGPQRIGRNGLEDCGQDIISTWETVNVNASVACRGLWVPELRQVWWNIATNGASFPNKRIVGQTTEMRRGEGGVRRGWSIDTGTSTSAITMCLFADNINAHAARSVSLKPVLGFITPTHPLYIGASGTTDCGVAYRARVRSKPLILGDLVQKFRIRAGTLFATAQSGVSVDVTLRRDFDIEYPRVVSVDLTPTASGEEYVMKPLDNLAKSELRALQVEVGDSAAVDNTWKVHMLGLVTGGEEGQ